MFDLERIARNLGALEIEVAFDDGVPHLVSCPSMSGYATPVSVSLPAIAEWPDTGCTCAQRIVPDARRAAAWIASPRRDLQYVLWQDRWTFTPLAETIAAFAGWFEWSVPVGAVPGENFCKLAVVPAALPFVTGMGAISERGPAGMLDVGLAPVLAELFDATIVEAVHVYDGPMVTAARTARDEGWSPGRRRAFAAVAAAAFTQAVGTIYTSAASTAIDAIVADIAAQLDDDFDTLAPVAASVLRAGGDTIDDAFDAARSVAC